MFKMYKLVVIVFSISYLYAIVRYQFGKGLWEGMDYIFTLNKSLSWTGGTCIAITLLPPFFLKKYELSRKFLGSFGYSMILFHCLFSFLLLSPNYYPSFYDEYTLNSHGWTNITFGILSLICFSMALLASLQIVAKRFLIFGKFGLIFNFLHVLNIGVLKWLPIDNWVLLMPPITLLYVLELTIIYLIRRRLLTKF